MKNFKLFLTLSLITILAVPAWAADGDLAVGDIIIKEEFKGGDDQTTWSNVTTKYGSSTSSITMKNSGDASYLSLSSDADNSAVVSTSGQTNMTGSHAWLNKNTTGYIEIDGIKLHNVTKFKAYWATNQTVEITFYYKFDGQTSWTSGGTSTVKGTANPSDEITVPNGKTSVSIKFQRKSSSTNMRIDDLKLEVTAISDGGSTTEKVATPTFDPAAGSYSSTQNVTISCTTSGATIYYTTDGSNPTTSSNVYSSAIPVSSTTTIKAIATKSGMTTSDVASATYTFSGGSSNPDINVTLSYKGTEVPTTLNDPYTLPTSITDDNLKCEGWEFYGWSTDEVNPQNTAPTTITNLTSGDDGAKVYAVYNQGGSGSSTATFTFGDMGLSNATSYTEFTVSPAKILADQGSGSNAPAYYSSDKTWRVYNGNSITISAIGGNVTDVSSNPTASFSISGGVATLNPTATIRFKTITVTTDVGGSGSGEATYTTQCNVASSTELEIVEWNPDYINIMVPDPNSASVVIEDKNENIAGETADDIFFSKYYEAASNMKLFALYNGTDHAIDLSKLRVRSGTGTGTTSSNHSWGTGTGDHNYVELANISKLETEHPGLQLEPNTEIIFWSNNKGSGSGATNNTNLRNCIAMDINGTHYTYQNMENDEVPNWYRIGDCECFYKYNNACYNDDDDSKKIPSKDADGNAAFAFNGDDPLVLERNVSGTWTAIDLIGAATGTPASLSINTSATTKITDTYEINGSVQALNDNPGGWYATVSDGATLPIPYSTNRYLLIRKNFVKSGAVAVEYNKTDFRTLGDFTEAGITFKGEWTGIPVGADGSANCYSGTKFSEIGEFDYATSYQQYEHVATVNNFDPTAQNPDGSYKVEIDQLDTLACTKLKINLYENGVIQATNLYDVPIMIDGDKTSDEVFRSYGKTKDICKTCDVVILKGGTLTKDGDGVSTDVNEVRNVTIYPQGKLIVPTGTNYKVNSLQFRVEDEDASRAQLVGNLTSAKDSVYVTRRINNNRYYFFSLPYACKVADIRWSNGEPATLGTDFWIREYNSQKRANNGWKAGMASNWDKIDPTTTQLEPMKGYIVAVGTDYKSELVFPMKIGSASSNVNVTTAENDKDNIVTVHTYTNGATTINNHNWNFIAQPFVSQLTPSIDADITVGELYSSTGKQDGWTFKDGSNEYITYYNADNNDYTQKVASGAPFEPFLAFFVQGKTDGQTYEFTKTNRILSAAPARHLAAKSEYEDESVFVGVTLSGNNKSDQTKLRVRPDFNEEYQLGYDLQKFNTKNAVRPVVYMKHSGYDLAFQAVSDDKAEKLLPMGIYVAKAGTYTFALSNDYPQDHVEAVYLYDAENGLTVNLMNDSYNFSTNTELQTTDRFFLSVIVRRDAPKVTTDNELVNEELPLTRKILINGHVFIQHGGKLFDITGKEMLNH